MNLSRRFKVRFPEPAAFDAAQAMESFDAQTRVVNERRRFLSVEAPPGEQGLALAERRLDAQLQAYESQLGGEVVPDYRYDLDDLPGSVVPGSVASPTLDDVLTLIRAPQAWSSSRGEGITIAVVDTGVDGTRPEFPLAKRQGQWQPMGEDAWADWDGHGTMAACIAAATRSAGGQFDGVAPDAGLISCRTHFYDSELTTIYDYLGDRVEQDGLRIVATNSFGIRRGTPPLLPPGSDFPAALEEAIGKGVLAVFSAGNNHHLANGAPLQCQPNSIWLYKSRADLLTVATCRLGGSMWFYSSRGPGQDFGHPNTNAKPDVTAPTPENGLILYGAEVRPLTNGWGTSGACPQVAGLAALLLAKDGSLGRDQVFDTIRATCRPIGHDAACEGAGLIDCAAALGAL